MLVCDFGRPSVRRPSVATTFVCASQPTASLVARKLINGIAVKDFPGNDEKVDGWKSAALWGPILAATQVGPVPVGAMARRVRSSLVACASRERVGELGAAQGWRIVRSGCPEHVGYAWHARAVVGRLGLGWPAGDLLRGLPPRAAEQVVPQGGGLKPLMSNFRLLGAVARSGPLGAIDCA